VGYHFYKAFDTPHCNFPHGYAIFTWLPGSSFFSVRALKSLTTLMPSPEISPHLKEAPT